MEWRADRRRARRPSATDPGTRGGPLPQVRSEGPRSIREQGSWRRWSFRKKLETRSDCLEWSPLPQLRESRSCESDAGSTQSGARERGGNLKVTCTIVQLLNSMAIAGEGPKSRLLPLELGPTMNTRAFRDVAIGPSDPLGPPLSETTRHSKRCRMFGVRIGGPSSTSPRSCVVELGWTSFASIGS